MVWGERLGQPGSWPGGMERHAGMEERNYERPEIVDFGTLTDLTDAQGLTGPEDGGSKALIHHSAPSTP